MSLSGKPLETLSVIDLGLGLSAALVTRMLADAGAEIRRIEPSAGDPFYELYPCYSAERRDAPISTAATPAAAIALAADRLATAVVCLVGGQDFPGVYSSVDVEKLARSHPSL